MVDDHLLNHGRADDTYIPLGMLRCNDKEPLLVDVGRLHPYKSIAFFQYAVIVSVLLIVTVISCILLYAFRYKVGFEITLKPLF